MKRIKHLGYGLTLLMWFGISSNLWAVEATSMLILVEGDVSVQIPNAAHAPMPLDKWPAGVEVSLPPKSALRLIYLNSGTLETWQGPARFTTDQTKSIHHQGQPKIRQLPKGAIKQMGKLNPDILASNIQRGGLTITRGLLPPMPKSISQEARQTYLLIKEQMPTSLAPELYWLSVLQEAGEMDLYQSHLQEILKQHPDWKQQLENRKVDG
jgi:hypothetical protein